MPTKRSLILHAIPIVIEGAIGPLVVFYGTLLALGFRSALLAGLAWSYLATIRRTIRGERVSSLLLLGAVLLTVRTAVSYAMKSSLVYFASPLAMSVAVAFVLFGSAIIKRPFTQRFANDFCPLSEDFLGLPRVHQFFVRVSYLWAFTVLTNAGVTLWLLFTSSLRSFVLERSAISWGSTAAAIVFSILGFLRTLRNDGVHVTWGEPSATPVPVFSPAD